MRSGRDEARQGLTRLRIVDLPQARKVATSFLLVDVLIPPSRELNLDVPSIVIHLAVNLVASAAASPSRALFEGDDGLVTSRIVCDDEVANEFEILGAGDEVATVGEGAVSSSRAADDRDERTRKTTASGYCRRRR